MKSLIAALVVFGSASVASATEINVGFSELFQEKLVEDFGPKEGDRLAEEIRDDLTLQLDKRGVAPAYVDVLIVDAEPNRPTGQQLRDSFGILDFGSSFSVGGMELIAIAYDEVGDQIGEIEYRFFDEFSSQPGATVWFDARRASDRFARKFAKQLAG